MKQSLLGENAQHRPASRGWACEGPQDKAQRLCFLRTEDPGKASVWESRTGWDVVVRAGGETAHWIAFSSSVIPGHRSVSLFHS